jgi:hypothetical protein
MDSPVGIHLVVNGSMTPVDMRGRSIPADPSVLYFGKVTPWFGTIFNVRELILLLKLLGLDLGFDVNLE